MKHFLQDYDPEEEDEDVEILTGWQAGNVGILSTGVGLRIGESQAPWRNSALFVCDEYLECLYEMGKFHEVLTFASLHEKSPA